MKSLVIAEKPSVARDIARVLHCGQKGNGCLEGKSEKSGSTGRFQICGNLGSRTFSYAGRPRRVR